jgi:hypothetical protein
MQRHKALGVRPSIEVLEDRLTPSATMGDHNCAGAVTSSLAGPGFGPVVASFAQQQLVDNFGLADCGLNSGVRQNP